jgi:hypothetical protein
MHIAFSKVDYAVSVVPNEVGITDVPFIRNNPVEDLGARKHLVHRETGQVLAQQCQGLTHTIAGQRAREGPQPSGELMHELTFTNR